MLQQSVFGAAYEDEIATGMYDNMSKADVAELLIKSDLSPMMYPKDKEVILKFIEENKINDSYDKTDVLDIVRMLLKMGL